MQRCVRDGDNVFPCRYKNQKFNSINELHDFMYSVKCPSYITSMCDMTSSRIEKELDEIKFPCEFRKTRFDSRDDVKKY